VQTTVDTTVQCRWRMTLNRSELIELLRAQHPEVPLDAEICAGDPLDGRYVEDDAPVTVTWTTTQTTHA
jgi:hypothetical protein